MVKEDGNVQNLVMNWILLISKLSVSLKATNYSKEHGTDFLMDNRHLWLRSRKQMAIQQIRNAIIYATYDFFDKMASSNLIVLSCLVMLLKIQQNCLRQTTLVHLLT